MIGTWVRALVALVSLVVVTACLTVLFLSMRAVMSVGGYCASGGPYVIAVECPDQVVALLPMSIVLGIVAAFGYAYASAQLPGPRLWPLLWPALFLSLGWNFMEFAFADGDAGVVWGWLICGVVFVAMGLLPLWLLLSKGTLRALLWSDAPTVVPVDPYRGTGYPAAATASRAGTASQPIAESRTPGDDLTGELERLTHLHERGALTDAEFAAAKKRLLEGE